MLSPGLSMISFGLLFVFVGIAVVPPLLLHVVYLQSFIPAVLMPGERPAVCSTLPRELCGQITAWRDTWLLIVGTPCALLASACLFLMCASLSLG